ncbi:Chordin-like protein 1 [Holothuria leucospilota]|uniref:Chordin-like protein 1 n=1 Tax=Holothuria leucospilota TaxID=206669 RepID=A0A9Q1H181_HOLLE|nr:Chordin-like protein 1 [Holothuria leucospilota]
MLCLDDVINFPSSITSDELVTSSPPFTSTAENCEFGDNTYQVGESWHPILEPGGMDRCITCHCNAPNRVSCDKMPCPPVRCSNPVRLENSCCHVCTKNNNTQRSSPSAVAPTPSKNSCRFQGRGYYDGQMFPGDQLFPGKRVDQCVQCTCSGGLIYCDLRTCPAAPCSDPEVRTGSCCPVCTSEGMPILYSNDISLPIGGSLDDHFLNGLGDNYPGPIEPNSINLEDTDRGSQLHENGKGRYARIGELLAIFMKCLLLGPGNLFSRGKLAPPVGSFWKDELCDLYMHGMIQNHLVEEIPSQNFERATVTAEYRQGRFELVGATTKLRFEKLLRRESRIKRRCSEECLEHIVKLPKVLRVSEVRRSLDCSQSEDTLSRRRRSLNR